MRKVAGGITTGAIGVFGIVWGSAVGVYNESHVGEENFWPYWWLTAGAVVVGVLVIWTAFLWVLRPRTRQPKVVEELVQLKRPAVDKPIVNVHEAVDTAAARAVSMSIDEVVKEANDHLSSVLVEVQKHNAKAFEFKQETDSRAAFPDHLHPDTLAHVKLRLELERQERQLARELEEAKARLDEVKRRKELTPPPATMDGIPLSPRRDQGNARTDAAAWRRADLSSKQRESLTKAFWEAAEAATPEQRSTEARKMAMQAAAKRAATRKTKGEVPPAT